MKKRITLYAIHLTVESMRRQSGAELTPLTLDNIFDPDLLFEMGARFPDLAPFLKAVGLKPKKESEKSAKLLKTIHRERKETMGEIKSTMDLVLEKTKHLKLTEDEKRQQQSKDINQKLNALIQKFQDQRASRETFLAEYAALQEEFKITNHHLLVQTVIDHIDPDVDNQALLSILQEFSQSGVDAVLNCINEYNAEADDALARRSEKIKAQLQKDHQISGSAVVPNLENDEGWQKEREKIRAKFDERLNQERDKILSS
jgi:hypothetical protein